MTVESALGALVHELVEQGKRTREVVVVLGYLERTLNELRDELRALRLERAGVVVPTPLARG